MRWFAHETRGVDVFDPARFEEMVLATVRLPFLTRTALQNVFTLVIRGGT